MFENLERDFRRFTFTTSRFLITRFPFWEALSTAMLLGEWDGRNRSHGIPDYTIYAHIGICILLGSLMSFDEKKRRHSALFAAVQMAFVTVVSFTIWSHSSQAVRLKIFSRNLGVVAAYLLLSSGFADYRASHKKYAQLGHLSIGICLLSEAYLLYTWSHQKKKLFYLLPSQLSSSEEFVTFIFCCLFCLCAFCFISGANLQAGSKCALALWAMVVLMDFDYRYWTKYIELWAQFRILASDICVASVLAVTYAMRW